MHFPDPTTPAKCPSELADEAQTTTIRAAAGIALKNALSAHTILTLPAEPKERVKQDVLRALASPSQKAGGVAAQIVAAIAAVELPNSQWPEIIEILLRFMDGPDNVSLKIVTLQAIGYICETIKLEILSMRSNEILTAVIHGARKEETSVDVQLAAINALYNSLEFVRDNFKREGERNYIMQVVRGDTKPVPDYPRMKHPEKSISLQAVEFWSTVFEEEIELAIEASEAAEYGEAPETESKNFAKIALPEILPVLLGLLTRRDEDADEDEWNVSMAAATCLVLLAQTVADAIVPAVIPFTEANIKAADWHQREAAVMTFGSILDGPDPMILTLLVTQALPILVDMTRDENLLVKDTVAWTLGRICDLLLVVLKPDEHLHPLISTLVNALEDKPRIVANCCWVLMNLRDQLGSFYEEEGPTLSSGPLAPYYEGIATATDIESNFRTSAYEALVSYVTHAGPESITVVPNTALAILSCMEHLLGMQNQLLGIDDRNNWNELQSNLCSVLISVVRKLGDGIEPLEDQIMTVFLSLIQSSKTSTVLEDAFLVVGTMAAALEVKFSPYIQAFLPFLYPALKAHEDTQLCTVAIGVIGDISRALGERSVQYAGPFMSVLLENLSSETLNRNVKIPILSCFGDIALAIGPGFEPYLDHTMNKVQLLLPYVQSMLELVQRCLADEEWPESVA
ncbi:ARM repeat-containing protein [Phellopilus nigrolimitatus]|nr:ARM repeat-containing protein [Phellopilus nigrolimitatus]